jgi:hypothetical protein
MVFARKLNGAAQNQWHKTGWLFEAEFFLCRQGARIGSAKIGREGVTEKKVVYEEPGDLPISEPIEWNQVC